MIPDSPLVATHARLHGVGAPGGLSPSQASALESALVRGEDAAEAAAHLGLDARVVASLAVQCPPDAPAAVTGLALLLAEQEAAQVQLRSAIGHPLLLAAGLLFATGMVVGVGAPAFDRLPAAPPSDGAGVLLVVMLPVIGLLLALAASLTAGLRLPGIGDIRRQVEAAAVLDCARVLCGAGTSLPSALRAGAAWCSAGRGARCLDLARALEAGGSTPTPEGVLLDPAEARMLFAAARTGTLAPSLEALSTHRRTALQRAIPAFVARVQTVAVLLAGLGVVSVGAFFFRGYSLALA